MDKRTKRTVRPALSIEPTPLTARFFSASALALLEYSWRGLYRSFLLKKLQNSASQDSQAREGKEMHMVCGDRRYHSQPSSLTSPWNPEATRPPPGASQEYLAMLDKCSEDAVAIDYAPDSAGARLVHQLR